MRMSRSSQGHVQSVSRRSPRQEGVKNVSRPRCQVDVKRVSRGIKRVSRGCQEHVLSVSRGLKKVSEKKVSRRCQENH